MRNKSFGPSRQPFRSRESIRLADAHTTGPVAFLNPTRARFRHTAIFPQERPGPNGDQPAVSSPPDKGHRSEDEQLASNIEFNWRSRDNRKGRHALVVQPSSPESSQYLTPKPTSSLHETGKGLLRMFTQYPYWDVSYLVAVIFTLGSVVWVLNAFFAYLPLAQPQTEFGTEILYGGGITAFIGATIFEIGSVLLMLEAVNENRTGCFGWALEKLLEGDGEKGAKVRVCPDKDRCSHHHKNERNLVGKSKGRYFRPYGIRLSLMLLFWTVTASASSLSITSSVSLNGFMAEQPKQPQYSNDQGPTWTWFPSTQDLKHHYIRELGFLACLAQFVGATIFWISGFTALPGINNNLGSQGLLDGIFWVPQIVGGTGFIISGALFMLETQSRWWKPAFSVLGWHIGFWNLVGAFGFTLCGALGPAYGNSGAEYEASLATFWGSWAFLIGSAIQWYESLDKHPVELEDIGKVS